MVEESSNSGQSRLEEAFASIQNGNSLEKQNKLWEAADAFFEAHVILNELATTERDDDKNDDSTKPPQEETSGEEGLNAAGDAATSGVASNKSNEEQQKIRALYRHQASEYFHKSRQALIKALQQESDKDREQQQQSPESSDDDAIHIKSSAQSMDDDEARQRVLLFLRLFARDQDIAELEKRASAGGESENENVVPVAEQASSLEERLAALNKSLPSGFKTSDERMRDINQGLNRLGLKLHSHSDATNKRDLMLDMPPKSETDQVDDIIAQAKDEVAMFQQQQQPEHSGATGSTTANGGGGAAGAGGNIPAPLSMDDVLLDDAGDSDLSDKDAWDDPYAGDFSAQDISAIQEKVNEAQAALAQLNALLEESLGDDDDDNDDVRLDQDSAKKKLRDARVLLQQATQRWRRDDMLE